MIELRTLGSFLDTLNERGDRTAMVALHKEDIESWSYEELADHTRRLAGGLRIQPKIGPNLWGGWTVC